MDRKKFIQNLIEQYNAEEEINFSESSKFKNHPSWDSLTALLVIDMIQNEYRVQINGDDIRKCQTIEDLINITSGKNG